VVEFNDFGDATIKESRKHDYQVIFARLAEEDIADRRRRQVHNRRLYKIVFDDGVWNEIFFLNLSNDGAAVPRLVQQYDPNVRVGRRTVRRVFALTNLGFKKDSALGERIENDLSPRTVYVELQPGKPTSGIRIRGTIGGDGTFSHDDNHITYSDYGDRGMQTMRGIPYQKMKLVEQKLEDPLDQGRRLVEVHGRINFRFAAHAPPAAKTQLSVVVSPRAGGQHRLIIQQDGNVTHVLPLVDDLWQQFAKETAALTNPRSVAAVQRLRKLFRNGLTFDVKSGEVSTLTFSGDVTDVALNELENFPRLTELTLAVCTKLTERGFAALKEANSIDTISFVWTPVSDAILLHACQLPNLRRLRIEDNRTAANAAAGQQVTDDGLKELSRLTELQSLTLSGSKITDHGLASLQKLDRLNGLRLAQTSVTPASFIKLGGSMSCKSMDCTTIVLNRKSMKSPTAPVAKSSISLALLTQTHTRKYRD
jgi:hypothetical protein